MATYGSAETAGGCVYDGLPLDGVAVAIGADGRIRIGGPDAVRRLRRRPGLTAEVLVDGWFLTADAGRFDEDGRLQVLGRLDDMVISGGRQGADRQSSPPGCASTRRVTAAEVGRLPDDEWGERVVAWVVGDLSLDEARDWVARAAPPVVGAARAPGPRRDADAPQRQGRPTARCGVSPVTDARVFSIPMRMRFRGITVREGLLIRGEAGWGEWSPFLEYDAGEAAAWLRCAEEAAAGDWPEPVRDRGARST